MKDVIYLVVNANQVVRMTKTLPSLKRGEVPIKIIDPLICRCGRS